MLGTLLWVTAIILDIFAITHVMNSNRDTFSKIVLIAVILLVPLFAAGIYLLIFRDKGYAV
jgi:membrane protein DedA with SNARE-associated domain